MATSESQMQDGLTSSHPYVSAHGRAQVVVFLFLAFIAVSLFSVVSNLLQINFLDDALATGGVSEFSPQPPPPPQGV